LALDGGWTIISADTDFGALLASTGATGPSVTLVREIVDRLPPDLVGLLLGCIDQLEAQLAAAEFGARAGCDEDLRDTDHNGGWCQDREPLPASGRSRVASCTVRLVVRLPVRMSREVR
jgi:hypothetical protein